MTRAEKMAEAARLRDYMTYAEIAAQLDVAKSTVYRWLNPEFAERDRVKCRAVKERYRGTCATCGAPTNGSNGPGTASDTCGNCSLTRQHDTRLWTPATVVEAIQAFARRYGRPPTATDFHPATARHLGHEWRAERFYADGHYPSATTVIGECSSWADAIEAAGFPRPVVGAYERVTDGHRVDPRGAHLDAERSAA